MPLTGRKKWIALGVALLAVGVAACGVAFWKRSQNYQAARRAVDRRDFRQAGLLLKRHLEDFPDDPAALLLAARTARMQGDVSEAREHLRRCEHCGGPKDSLALEEKLLRVQQGELAEFTTMLESCASHPAAPETPLMLEALIEGALQAVGPRRRLEDQEVLSHLARARQAIDLWLRSRPGRPDQVQGLVWRGRATFPVDYDRAIADLRQALEKDPDSFQARLHLALGLAEKETNQAAEHLKVLHEKAPENNQVRYGLATAQRALGRPEEARKLLDDMLDANPDDVAALVERAEVALDAQAIPEADQYLRKALGLAPDSPEANLAMSRRHRLARKVPEENYFRKRFEQLDAARKARLLSPGG
jgi:tetratricopeptide (TPR) repeat protein